MYTEAEIVAALDGSYAQRADISLVEESLRLIAATHDPSFAVAWRFSRANFFLGQQAQRKAARAHHRQGVTMAKRAVVSRPNHVEGHFWLGVNLAMLAQQQAPLTAILNACRARRALENAIYLDCAYHEAGPLRVLARLQQRLPRIFGGGLAHARQNYERALAIAPQNTVTRIYFAELLLQQGDRAAATEQLEVVLRAADNPDWAFEINRDKNLANQMLRSC